MEGRGSGRRVEGPGHREVVAKMEVSISRVWFSLYMLTIFCWAQNFAPVCLIISCPHERKIRFQSRLFVYSNALLDCMQFSCCVVV